MAVSIEKNQDWQTPEQKSPAQKAVEAKKPFNGPHSPRAMKKLAEEKEEIMKANSPAYRVDVNKKSSKEAQGEDSPDDIKLKAKLTYTPEEVRTKAKTFMASGKLTPEEKRVLQEILGPDEE